MLRRSTRRLPFTAMLLATGVLAACGESPVEPRSAAVAPSVRALNVLPSDVVTIKNLYNGGGVVDPTYGPIGGFQAQIVTPNLGNITVYCIDIDNPLSLNQQWNARILSFNDIVNNPANLAAVRRALGQTPWAGDLLTLRKSAYLTSLFDLNPEPSSSFDEIQYDIWNLFGVEPSAPSNPLLAATFLTSATTFASNAANNTDGWKLIVDNNAFDPSYTGPYVQTLITYDPTTPLALGRMTGGGIKAKSDNDEDVTFGLTLHCDILLSNNLEVNWKGHSWHLDKPIQTAQCSTDPTIAPPPPAAPFNTFVGTAYGKLDDKTPSSYAIFKFQDAGEPGKNDTVEMTIFEGGPGSAVVLHVSFQKITNGNWQMHYDQPHGNKP